MSDSTSPARAGCIVPVIAVTLTAVVIVAAAAFFVGDRYLGYRAQDGPSALTTTRGEVQILDPAQGDQFEVAEPVVVDARAVGPETIKTIQLWVDGELAGEQAAPGDPTEAQLDFLWQPSAVGVHSLVARAVYADGQGAYSPSVNVYVGPSENAEGDDGNDDDLTQNVSVHPPADNGGGAGDPGSVGPAAPWGGSPGEWVDSLTNDEPPAAPGMSGLVVGCSAELLIHDQSDNEEGFVVYRSLGNSPDWQEIATLAAQSANDAISYMDSGTPGGRTYYVAAFNSQGQADSPLLVLNVETADCPDDQASNLPVLQISLDQLPNLVPLELAYCYYSLNNTAWQRWPETGFFIPDESGELLEAESIQQLLTTLEGEPVFEGSLLLHLKCWGWSGGVLHNLGEEIIDLNDPSDDLQLSAGIDVSLGTVGPGKFYPIGQTQLISTEDLKDLTTLNVIEPTIPGIFAWVTTDPEMCESHLPSDAQNLLGRLFYCFPYDGYDTPDGPNPQPYLVWDMGEGCLAGFGTPEPCKPYSYWLQKAEDNGGQVGFNVFESSSVGFFSYNITDPELMMMVVPPTSCFGQRNFSAQLWYSENGETVYGPTSNPTPVPCPPIIPLDNHEEIATVAVTFNNLFLEDADDGCCADDVEIFGFMRVAAPAMGQMVENPLLPFLDPVLAGHRRYLNIAKWDQQGSECPDDQFHATLQTGGTFGAGCPQQIENGAHAIRDWQVCRSTGRRSCKLSGFVANNNTLEVQVRDGDTLTLKVLFIDWDDSSGNDVVCESTKHIGPHSMAEWQAMSNNGFTMSSGDFGSGACDVVGDITIVP